MSSYNRLTKAYEKAKRIAFDDKSKFIFFSDCHRGDNSFSDDFSRNRNIYSHALSHYLKEGFTYVELGDGDELWENKNFDNLFEAHKNIYELLLDFYKQGRLHMIYGNHDMVYKNENAVKRNYSKYFDRISWTNKEFFGDDFRYHESLVLEHKNRKQEIFLLHGHQADFLNYVLWKFTRFMVRFVWRPLQIIGFYDPTSPARNNKELIKVEKRIERWIRDYNIITVIGHTHRPRFSKPSEVPFFNDGSCVHPRSITGIEIDEGQIMLIKWHVISKFDGTLQITRQLLEGPSNLEDYVFS